MVADPVHFRPDPADQNFKNWLRVPDPTGLTKNQFKNLIFFHINLSSSDIWMMITPDPTKKVWIRNPVWHRICNAEQCVTMMQIHANLDTVPDPPTVLKH